MQGESYQRLSQKDFRYCDQNESDFHDFDYKKDQFDTFLADMMESVKHYGDVWNVF